MCPVDRWVDLDDDINEMLQVRLIDSMIQQEQFLVYWKLRGASIQEEKKTCV